MPCMMSQLTPAMSFCKDDPSHFAITGAAWVWMVGSGID